LVGAIRVGPGPTPSQAGPRQRRFAFLRRRHAVSRAHEPSLFASDAFALYWLSRLMTQTAQGALIYGLLVILVDRTNASFFNSLFVSCAIIPSLAFGLPAGVVVDAVPRKPLMVLLNVLRFAFALALVSNRPALPGIFAGALGIWTIHQFYSPAESALLASIVPPHRYTSAQAMSNLALTLAQLFGLVMLAPSALKFASPATLFAVCGLLFILAAICTGLIPRVEHFTPRAPRQRRTMRETLLTGWGNVRLDHTVYAVMVDDILVGIGSTALVVMVPLYLKGVLDTAAENTVFVFAPAALGLILGLRLSSPIDKFFGARRVAGFGLILFSLCIASFGFVGQFRDILNHTLHIPTDRFADALSLPPLIFLVMLISIPTGFASSVVSVSARAVLLARTAPQMRGQVIATQSLLQNLGALIPTFLAGIAADLFGVKVVAVAIAFFVAFGALLALTVFRPMPATHAPQPG
jgi:MFS family permease